MTPQEQAIYDQVYNSSANVLGGDAMRKKIAQNAVDDYNNNQFKPGSNNVAAPAPITASQGGTTGVSGGNLNQEDIYNQNKSFAQQSVTTGPALQAALAQRIKDMGDISAEQFNYRGQSPQAGVFQEALARDIGRQGLEAELVQQGRLSDTIGKYFGQGRELGYGMAGQNVGALNRATEFNAGQAFDASKFNAGMNAQNAENSYQATQNAQEEKSKKSFGSRFGRGVKTGAQGAATGAAIGSVIPGVGTAVGAGVGGLAGLIGGMF